jgi:hypothetical protein
VQRLRRSGPVGALALERVKCDTHLLQHAASSGIAYQQAELAGYEVREYLLEKWGRQCAYCKATNVPLQVEHIVPKTRHGSNRVSNLTLACKPCTDAQGRRAAAEFGYPEVQAQAQAPLRDAAAVNTTRWALYQRLKAIGLPKTHWLDAVCVGESTPMRVAVRGCVLLQIMAMGRNSRQLGRTNASGFPDKAPKATSVVRGLRSGASVRAVGPASSVKAGTSVGRIAVRASGSCHLTTATGVIQGVHVRCCRPLHRGDGSSYEKGDGASSPDLKVGVSAPEMP